MRGESVQRSAVDALTLLSLPRIGLREWHRRVRAAGSVAAALSDERRNPALAPAVGKAEAAVHAAELIGAAIAVHGSAEYPAVLNDLTESDSAGLTPAPPVLFALGSIALLGKPTVALVGTRQATAPGLRAAERIARECAEAGALVISGLARGIDAAAHTGALNGSGTTAAVIGTGLDVAYPVDHRALQQRIAECGVVLTELAPGQRATRGSFPERNRLIAALAHVTIVVEAGHKSGALLTANAAMALNRLCAAVPGTFDSASCLGSNELLRDGAHVIASVNDVLALLQIPQARERYTIAPDALNDAERAIWNVLGSAPLDLDLVVQRAGWAAEACLSAVTTLELKGLVRATHNGALQRA